MKKVRKTALYIVITLLLLWSAPPTNAQQSQIGLTVSPPVQYLQLKPGAKRVHTITVENSSARALTVTPSIQDFTTDERGILQLLPSSSFPYIANSEQVLTPATLSPGQKAQVTLSIQVPNQAPTQEYHQTVLFSATPPGNQAANGAGLSAVVGSNLIVLVSGENEHAPQLKLKEIRAPRVLDSFSSLEFAPLAGNERFHASTASGSAQIKNWRGKPVAQFEIYPDVVLGFSSRQLRSLSGTQEEPVPESFIYSRPFLFGPYTIHIELLNISETARSSQVLEKTVFAFPIALSASITLAALIIGLYFGKIKYSTSQGPQY